MTQARKKDIRLVSNDGSYFDGRIVGGKLSQMATYSDLFERTTDGIFLVDFQSDVARVLECNPASEKLLGAPKRGIEGRDLLDWVKSSYHKHLKQALQRAWESHHAIEPFDVRFKDKEGGELTVELSACRLKLADYCEILQVIGKDVSAVRSATAALEEANHKLELLSSTDEMTGLNNFRTFKQELAKEHARALRYGTPYAIVFCDVDHFKHYNDRNGHPAGDEVLKKVAQIFKTCSRATDFPARYGGEEFVVLCPGVSAGDAAVLAESLRKTIEATDFAYGQFQPMGRVTVSVGVSSFPGDGQDSERVLKAADEALYRSKGAGRNRVTSSR